MSYKKEGTVTKIFELKQITDTFSKIDFVVLETDTRYPKEVLFTASGKTLPYMEQIKEGDVVEVEFDLEAACTKDKSKYFGNNAKAFKVFKIGSHSEGDNESYAEAPETKEATEDDLPF